MLQTAKEQTRKDRSLLPRVLLVLFATQVFSTFLSDVKLVPTVRANVSWPEVNALFLMVLLGMYVYKRNLLLKGHVLLTIAGLWVLAAFFSLVNFWGATETRIMTGLTATLGLAYVVTLVFVIYNLLHDRPDLLLLGLRITAWVVAFMCLWVLNDQRNNPYDLLVSGPFRNRAQMGVYMFSAIWIVMLYVVYPSARWFERIAGLVIVGLVMYLIASSSRQSLYFVAIVAFGLVAMGFIFVTGRDRIIMLVLTALLVTTGVTFYSVATTSTTQLANFKAQFDGLGAKLDEATTSEEDIPDTPNQEGYFETIQRAGAFRAFGDYPILGIGFAGFFRSTYSPTGHELHSTWLRFVAELGIVGTTLYIAFLAVLFTRGALLFWRVRGTRYQLSVLMCLIGFISLTVSHYYNRMFTDRAYWLFLAFFLILESNAYTFLATEKAKELAAKPAPAAVWQPVVLAHED